MARLSWVALKPLLHTTRIFFSWHCRGTSYHIFSLCVSLLALRLSSSLCFAPANTRLPPRNIFRALFPIFFHQGYERERGRGGKQMNKEREYDEEGMRYCTEAVTLTEHWAMYKGIRLGATAGEHWFVSCFLSFSAPFFLLAMSVGVCAWWFFCVPARLRFISLFLYLSRLFFTAPHEICKDEHLLSMSWKRASAGETVYNKCPTNATGQSHDML